jgi:hypothetical protein
MQFKIEEQNLNKMKHCKLKIEKQITLQQQNTRYFPKLRIESPNNVKSISEIHSDISNDNFR